MLMGDFLSLKQLKLPIKIIVFNNGALSFVELRDEGAGIRLTAQVSLIPISQSWLRLLESWASRRKA